LPARSTTGRRRATSAAASTRKARANPAQEAAPLVAGFWLWRPPGPTTRRRSAATRAYSSGQATARRRHIDLGDIAATATAGRRAASRLLLFKFLVVEVVVVGASPTAPISIFSTA
jgi:hypothetical protein